MRAWMVLGPCLFAGGSMQAEVLLEMPQADPPAKAFQANASHGAMAAVGLTLPAGVGYTLDAVDLQLGPPQDENTVVPQPRVRLFSSDANRPDAALAVLSGSADVGSVADLETFSAPANMVLNAGETYWIVVDNTATVDVEVEEERSSFWWYGPGAGAFAATPATPTSPAYFTTTDGDPWTAAFADETYSVIVRGTVIPEPATLALVALGVAATAGRPRRVSMRR